MKALKTWFFPAVISCLYLHVHAQSGTATHPAQPEALVKQRALMFADSLLQCFRNDNWNDYLDLSYPGVVKYYGGPLRFKEHLRRSRSFHQTQGKTGPEKIGMVQLVRAGEEWQCVVRRTSSTYVDGHKAVVTSYIVGQSRDGGRSWQYVDVAHHASPNVAYIMPDIFESITIPQRQIVFDRDGVASKR